MLKRCCYLRMLLIVNHSSPHHWKRSMSCWSDEQTNRKYSSLGERNFSPERDRELFNDSAHIFVFQLLLQVFQGTSICNAFRLMRSSEISFWTDLLTDDGNRLRCSERKTQGKPFLTSSVDGSIQLMLYCPSSHWE